jgi:hypothetical protein
VIKTLCFPTLISSTYDDLISPLAEAKMRPAGSLDSSAQVDARRVINLRELSWRDALTSFLSYIRLLKILSVLPMTPVKNPFSSIL